MRITFHIINGQGEYVLVVGIFHYNIVGLIPYIGAVTIRAVGGKVGILIDIHSFCRNALVLVGFVECCDQLFNIAKLNGSIIFQYFNNGTFFKFAGEARHDLVVEFVVSYAV